jgi:hypothetical protein
MPETLRPLMDHYKQDDRTRCSNNSPVIFEKNKRDEWVPTEYDYKSWSSHEHSIGVMICETCLAFVRKVPRP